MVRCRNLIVCIDELPRTGEFALFSQRRYGYSKDLMMNRNSSEDSDSVLVGLPQENAPNVKPPIK